MPVALISEIGYETYLINPLFSITIVEKKKNSLSFQTSPKPDSTAEAVFLCLLVEGLYTEEDGERYAYSCFFYLLRSSMMKKGLAEILREVFFLVYKG